MHMHANAKSVVCAQVEPARDEVAAETAESAEDRVDASKPAAASRKPKKIRRPMGAVRLPRGTPKPTGQRRDSSSRRQRYGHLAEEGELPAAALHELPPLTSSSQMGSCGMPPGPACSFRSKP